MSLRSKPFGAGWGNTSLILVAPDHEFFDEDARDAYFLIHPGELFDGLFCYITSRTMLQRWSVGTNMWEDRTPVIQGSSGYSGYVGSTGFSGYSGYSGISYVGFTYTQSIPSALWGINHNLGYKYPTVVIVDTSDHKIDSIDITYTDENNLSISFSSPIAGKAIIK